MFVFSLPICNYKVFFVTYFNALSSCVSVLCLSFVSNKMFFTSLEVGAVDTSSHFSWLQADCYGPGQSQGAATWIHAKVHNPPGGLATELCTV